VSPSPGYARINRREEEGRSRPCRPAGECNPDFLSKSILSLIFTGVMFILATGWEKEDAMNATACCNGKELTYCEDLCIFATEERAKTEDSQTFWYNLPEGFSGP
jgi:hypothetical protein